MFAFSLLWYNESRGGGRKKSEVGMAKGSTVQEAAYAEAGLILTPAF
jgi:hypothetical protein